MSRLRSRSRQLLEEQLNHAVGGEWEQAPDLLLAWRLQGIADALDEASDAAASAQAASFKTAYEYEVRALATAMQELTRRIAEEQQQALKRTWEAEQHQRACEETEADRRRVVAQAKQQAQLGIHAARTQEAA